MFRFGVLNNALHVRVRIILISRLQVTQKQKKTDACRFMPEHKNRNNVYITQDVMCFIH